MFLCAAFSSLINVFILFSCLGLGTQLSLAQDENRDKGATIEYQANSVSILDTKIRRLRVADNSLPEVVKLLGNRIPFRYSLEVLPCKDIELKDLEKPITIDIENISLGEAFDRLVALSPGFAWRSERNGLIRFFPAKCDDDPSHLALRVIPSYAAIGLNLEDAIQELGRNISDLSPKFKWSTEPSSGFYRDPLGDPILLSVSRENITVREILDLLAAKLDMSWILSYDPLRQLYTPTLGKEFALSIKMADVETAKTFGVTIDADKATTLELVDKLQTNKKPRKNQILSDPLIWGRNLSRFKATNSTVPAIIEELAKRMKFQYSIEAVPFKKITSEDLLRSISMEVKDYALLDILDALVVANKAYEWEMVGGIVRFRSRGYGMSEAQALSQVLPNYQAVAIELPEAMDLLVKDITVEPLILKLLNGVNARPRDEFDDPILLNYKRENISARQVLDNIAFKFDESWMLLPDLKEESLSLSFSNKLNINTEVLLSE